MTLIAVDLLLLLLDDDSGALPALWTDVQVPLGAAVLAELELAGAVHAGPPPLEDGVAVLSGTPWPSPTVTAEDGADPDDPLLREALATARTRAHTADELAAVLGDGLLERLTDRLVDAGVLERHESRLLGVMPRTRWPALRTEEEAVVRDALRRALLDDAESERARERAVAIAEDVWAARPVRDAVAQTAAASGLGGTGLGGSVFGGPGLGGTGFGGRRRRSVHPLTALRRRAAASRSPRPAPRRRPGARPPRRRAPA